MALSHLLQHVEPPENKLRNAVVTMQSKGLNKDTNLLTSMVGMVRIWPL
jgi:hypothetical protein